MNIAMIRHQTYIAMVHRSWSMVNGCVRDRTPMGMLRMMQPLAASVVSFIRQQRCIYILVAYNRWQIHDKSIVSKQLVDGMLMVSHWYHCWYCWLSNESNMARVSTLFWLGQEISLQDQDSRRQDHGNSRDGWRVHCCLMKQEKPGMFDQNQHPGLDGCFDSQTVGCWMLFCQKPLDGVSPRQF